MQELGSGALDKLRAALTAPVTTPCRVGESEVPLNEHLGRRLRIEFSA